MTESLNTLDRYLDLMQEVLINSIYQDRAMDPWSQPVFDVAEARLAGSIGRTRRSR